METSSAAAKYAYAYSVASPSPARDATATQITYPMFAASEARRGDHQAARLCRRLADPCVRLRPEPPPLPREHDEEHHRQRDRACAERNRDGLDPELSLERDEHRDAGQPARHVAQPDHAERAPHQQQRREQADQELPAERRPQRPQRLRRHARRVLVGQQLPEGSRQQEHRHRRQHDHDPHSRQQPVRDLVAPVLDKPRQGREAERLAEHERHGIEPVRGEECVRPRRAAEEVRDQQSQDAAERHHGGVSEREHRDVPRGAALGSFRGHHGLLFRGRPVTALPPLPSTTEAVTAPTRDLAANRTPAAGVAGHPGLGDARDHDVGSDRLRRLDGLSPVRHLRADRRRRLVEHRQRAGRARRAGPAQLRPRGGPRTETLPARLHGSLEFPAMAHLRRTGFDDGRELLGDRAAGAADDCPRRDRRVRPQGGREAPPSRDARDLGGGTGSHAGRHSRPSRSTSPAWARSSRFWWRAWCAGWRSRWRQPAGSSQPGRSARALAGGIRGGLRPLAAGRLPEGGVDLRAGPLPLPLRRARSPLARGRSGHGTAIPVAGLPARGCSAHPAPAPHDVRGHAGHRGRRDGVRRDVPSGIGGWAERLRYSAEFQWIFARELGTFVWPGVAAAVPFMLLAWAFGHRRVPWLPLGLLAAGLAVYLFQGLGGVPATRYFIPFLALLATAAVILLADGPRWIQLAGVVMVALFLWDNVDRAHVGVEGWTAGQTGRHRRGRRGGAPGPGALPRLHGPVPCRGRRCVPRADRARQQGRPRAQAVRPAIQGHHGPGSPPASTRYQRGHLRNLRRSGMGAAQNRRGC